jgi:hypothetical protein
MGDHREKKAFVGRIAPFVSKHAPAAGEFLHKHEDAVDLAGLGVLAAAPTEAAIHELRKSPEERDNRELVHAGLENAGLGVLAAAPAAKLLMARAKMASILDELEKIGFVSDAEAENALASIQALEQDKPTKRQTLGYMGAGAILTPAFHIAGNAIRKRPLLEGANTGEKARDALAQAVKGGLGGTAVSMAQRHIDRNDKTNTLKAYLAQHQAQEPDLQKAAEKKDDEEKKPSNLRKALVGMGLGTGMTLGNQVLGQHLQKQIETPDEPLYDAVKAKAPKGLNIHEGHHDDVRGVGPHFLAGKETPLRAHLPKGMRAALDVDPYVATAGSKNPAILAHELGHVDIHNNRLGKMLQNPATISAGGIAPGVGSLAGAVSGMTDNETAQKAGLLAPALLSLPQLAFEAGASIQGLRRMRGAGANTQQLLQGAKTLAPAFGTYATRAGLGAANAYATQGIVGGVRHALTDDDSVKQAGAPRVVGPKMPGLAGSGTPVMPMPKPKPVGTIGA